MEEWAMGARVLLRFAGGWAAGGRPCAVHAGCGCVRGRAWGVGRGAWVPRASPVEPAQLYDIFIDIFLVDRRDWQCKPHTLGDRGLLEVCIVEEPVEEYVVRAWARERWSAS